MVCRVFPVEYCRLSPPGLTCFFFFNDTATTEIYTLSLHDALPICCQTGVQWCNLGSLQPPPPGVKQFFCLSLPDRKSTRLNSSHLVISYAVFCLKKKKGISQLFQELR